MNRSLEHILLSDTISDDELARLSDACVKDTGTETSVRRLVMLLEELEKRSDNERAIADEQAFLEEWKLEFPEGDGEPAIKAAVKSIKTPELRLLRLRSAVRWVAAAAIVVSIGLFSYVTVQPPAQATLTVAAVEGEFVIHELSDGSIVRISPGSSIGITENGTVSLEGSAFFSITPQNSALQVVTANTTTEVLGTQFGIFEAETSTQIVMMEGVVAFSSNQFPDRSVRLELNQTSIVVGSEAPSQPGPVDIMAALSWTDLIVFRSLPLKDVAETLAVRLGVRIDVDESIRGLTFTNTFRPEQGITEMLNTVALALNIVVVEGDDSGSFTLQPKL